MYQRHGFEPEKRIALEAWARHVAGLTQPPDGKITAQRLHSREEIAAYIEVMLEDGDPRAVPVALRTVADALGELAQKTGLSRETPSLRRDIAVLDELLERAPKCRLVIIDPISAYLDGADSHNNADVRALLAPLSAPSLEHRRYAARTPRIGPWGGAYFYKPSFYMMLNPEIEPGTTCLASSASSPRQRVDHRQVREAGEIPVGGPE